ncbi:MAG: hypothetical protein P4M05_02905 [Bradyrhizobium sp.]|jgi:hypothetical protein|nr:hypothetical protein [Bradyrhizobium sp.]
MSPPLTAKNRCGAQLKDGERRHAFREQLHRTTADPARTRPFRASHAVVGKQHPSSLPVVRSDLSLRPFRRQTRNFYQMANLIHLSEITQALTFRIERNQTSKDIFS